MVKGLTKRIVVLDAPDQKFFEQAIFIVRNDAPTEGITAKALVEEAQWVAKTYATSDSPQLGHRFLALPAVVHALCGAGAVGMIWLGCYFL